MRKVRVLFVALTLLLTFGIGLFEEDIVPSQLVIDSHQIDGEPH